MKKNQISQDDWWKEMNEKLSAFHSYWNFGGIKNSYNYPTFLNSGDWDEQFVIFSEKYDSIVKENGFYSLTKCEF